MTCIYKIFKVTHVYCFDNGIPPNEMKKIAKVFNTSTSVMFFICFQKPKQIIDEYRFRVEYMDIHQSCQMYAGGTTKIFLIIIVIAIYFYNYHL